MRRILNDSCRIFSIQQFQRAYLASCSDCQHFEQMDAFDFDMISVLFGVLVSVAAFSFLAGWFLRAYFCSNPGPLEREYFKLKKKETALHKNLQRRSLPGRSQSEIEAINLCKFCF